MSSITPPTTNPSIDETLSQLRLLIRKYLTLRGATLAGIFLISFFWISGLLDYLPVWLGAQDSPRMVRAFFLAVGASCLSYLLWRYVVQPMAVHWTDRAIALLIERKFPQAKNAIITYVENRTLHLDREKSALARSWKIDSDPKLQAKVVQEAESAIGSIDVYEIMQWKPLQLQSGIFGALIAISILAFLAMPNWTMLWGKRLFLLSSEIWPRQSSIDVDYIEIAIPNFTGETERRFYQVPFRDNLGTIPAGQSARLYASADLDAKVVPSFITLNYRLEDGQTGRSNLRRLNANLKSRRQPFMLDGSPLEKMKQSLRFSLRGGDARIRDLELEMVPAVALVDVELIVQFPEYLRRRQTSTYLDGSQPYRNGLRLPEGVQVTMRATANQELQRCEYRLLQQSGTPEAVVGTIETTGKQFDLPLGVLRDNTLVEFRTWDRYGHSAVEISQYVITIIEDQLPSGELTLQGIGTSVTPLARLPMNLLAKDDHDIKDAIARLIIGDTPSLDSAIDYSANGEFRKQIDLRDLRDQSKISVQPGEVLIVSAEVDDFYDLDNSTRKASSNAIPLTVVTTDELLVLLDRRELDLRNRLEQVIVELSQLEVLISKNRVTNQPIADDADSSEDTGLSSAIDRMRLVRTQEAKVQIEKSIGELQGIAVQIASINAELVNNRIDSTDRQIRLEEKIRQPILRILDQEFQQILTMLKETELELRDNNFQLARVDQTLELNARIVGGLKEILTSMLDIQDYNEVVDMLRDILQKQESLLEKTKEEQKKRALDIFK